MTSQYCFKGGDQKSGTWYPSCRLGPKSESTRSPVNPVTTLSLHQTTQINFMGSHQGILSTAHFPPPWTALRTAPDGSGPMLLPATAFGTNSRSCFGILCYLRALATRAPLLGPPHERLPQLSWPTRDAVIPVGSLHHCDAYGIFFTDKSFSSGHLIPNVPPSSANPGVDFATLSALWT